MTNPNEDILMSMALLRNNVQGKSKEFKQAVGTYYAKRKLLIQLILLPLLL